MMRAIPKDISTHTEPEPARELFAGDEVGLGRVIWLAGEIALRSQVI